MQKSLNTPLIIAVVFLFAACGKTRVDPVTGPISAHPVFVVCEGTLGNGNSALTVYNTDSNKAIENIYQAVNGSSLGDVFQSMTRINRQYFLCINNSDKILVVDSSTLLLKGSVQIQKPRYILPISATKAYVSSLFSNKLFVINPQTLSITDTILMPFNNPEGMLLSGNTAYICTWDTAATSIYPINVLTNTLGAGVSISAKAPQEIVKDKEGMFWVLSGNVASGVDAYLARLNPATGAILKSYSFGAGDPVRLVFNNAKDSLYFIEVSYTGSATNNGVYRMGIHDATLPTTAFIPAQGLQYFWGLGIQPSTGLIYVADPIGFTQRGKVFVYQADGTLKTTFATGVGPGHFLFE